MTFPRRLTPSDTQRATIVQQRMTPGAALGVGSRHVRNGNQPASTPAAATAAGPISAVLYRDPGNPGYGGRWNLSGLVDSIGDTSWAAYDSSTGDITLNDAGDYVANIYATVTGAAAGVVLYLEALVSWDGLIEASWTCRGGSFFEFPSVSTIPFHTDGFSVDGASVNGEITRAGTGGTISNASVYIVRLG